MDTTYTVVIEKQQTTEIQVQAKNPKDAVTKASLFFDAHREMTEEEMQKNEQINFIVNY